VTGFVTLSGSTMVPERMTTRALVLLLAMAACGGSEPTPVTEPPPAGPETPIWPVAGVKTEDADSVHAPYGPRALPDRYDFHAGIDIPAARGTPVHAVLAGVVVQLAHWDGTSVGAGNAITIRHANGSATSYLHLDAIAVTNGASVRQGAAVGTVGRTGSSYSHLHLGYFPALVNNARDERVSRNPLEILPYRTSAQHPTAAFDSISVELDVPLRQMTIVSVEVRGGAQTRRVNYYDVVQLGSTARDQQVQSGVRIDAGRPSAGRFILRLTPLDFAPDRVIVTAFDGSVILDQTR
jgi:murein DD-endopeptidase MepM/ murein hydrolase activator NlpD